MKLKLIFISLLLIITGCGRSIIKYTAVEDKDPFQIFGRTPAREFFVSVDLSDSLVLKWESDMYGSFPNSSVSIYENLVFINDLSGRIYCYNIETGKQVGKLKYSKGAVLSTPLPFRSLLIFPVAREKENYTELVYYDYVNGKEIELIELPGRVLTNLLLVDDEIIFTTEIGTVYRYNLLGDRIWETHTRVPTRCNPAFENDLIVFGNDNGEIIALKASNGDSVYVSKIGNGFQGGVTIDSGIIYTGNENGNLYAINLNDGGVIWQFETDSRIVMTPAYDSENIYLGNLSGNFFSINKKTGKKNWQINFKGVLNSTPLVTNNKIILPDVLFAVHVLNKNDGEVVNSIELEGRAKLSPVYHRNLLFIGFDAGIIRAYEFIE
ncbi:MAG: PQQ-binding-like beta-propeller repeat protein [Ignavibacteria bacterium]|nr:PQQ-binding-like beta-propeller repeat protein [Ignavibacteria bacterium]MBT8382674.1 PQQ-binding-like beta-propeller repeat protein [Ignavibacteria bacterium]MBT8391743.1 PQQ-binding-like beta-propeller repeat protein [Ignavibacteria bacterium]NNJ51583.1 PQQ-binding-like beta-propeller repeat protein [Ignavibacteriaceae bacterium]NNL20321.1 PQQ-binding-like beta-propeller repeat protein [Ignavibacteriaceae bacterium]